MDEYTYIVNVDGVVVRDDAYLLIERGANENHASGLLAFPGGKVEQQPGNENAIETTVRRELSEEVGVEVGTVEYVLSTTFETDDGSQCLNIVMLCEHGAGNAHPRASDEAAAIHWLSYDEIKARDDIPSFTERFTEQVEKFRLAE